MPEVFGALLFLVLALYWIAIAGPRTNTVVQSSVSLVVYSTLNFGLFRVFGLVEDQALYYFYGANLANVLLVEPSGASSQFPPGKESYVWILALLFVLFGQSPLPGLALSALLMVTLPAIFVWTGRNLGLFASGALTAWLVVLSPPLLLWGHGLNREPLVFFLLACLLLSYSWISRGRWALGAMGVVAVGLALSSTRSSLLAVVLVGAFVFAVLRLLDVTRRTGLASLSLSGRHFALLSLVPVALFIPVTWVALRTLDSSSWRNFGIGIPELSGAGQATAVVGATWTYNSSFEGFFYNLVRALVGPVPWEVTNTSLLFFAAEGSGYLLFLTVLVLGVSSRGRVRDVGVALATTALPLVVAASLLMANYGLNSRIRAHVFLLLLVLVEPIVTRHALRWKNSLSSGGPVRVGLLRGLPTRENV